MGMAQIRVRQSETVCVIWMPSIPKAAERIHTSGMKKTPCRAMARKVAGAVRPMVWSIILLITTHPWKQKVTH